MEGALKHRAVTIIIAHNHPGGVAEPSDNDDKITEQIKNALQTVNINLQEMNISVTGRLGIWNRKIFERINMIK